MGEEVVGSRRFRRAEREVLDGQGGVRRVDLLEGRAIGRENTKEL